MVKLFKTVLDQVMEETRRKPSLIELQTFFTDAVEIVNDRPLTTLSDQPNDLRPITPSFFLGQHLAPNTPLCGLHDQGDFRNDYLYNSTLAHRFWLLWMKSYLPSLQGLQMAYTSNKPCTWIVSPCRGCRRPGLKRSV